jgi:maltooligosyltrehalose trehalohydrolase
MRFSVWAPKAQHSVDLVLDEHGHESRAAMQPTRDGHWEVDHDAPVGTRYAFSLDGGEPLPDPRALRLPDGPSGFGAVVDYTQFNWTDQAWRGVPLPGAVVYELHVGTFTHEGTFDAAIEHLDHLTELGIDIVELMPVATFPGRYGWGYDGVGLYAVHEPYGGPDGLVRFVDACHARGLGVALDVVYNHLGPSGNRLSDFGPYFTDRYGTPWGEALNLDDADSDPVRRFIIDNALMWLREFHIDGLRLDAVHALYDDRAVTLLEELSSQVSASSAGLGRPLWLIAESDRNDPNTVTPREGGGLGLHAQWADDVHHAIHVALTGETQGYYADFAEPGALTKVLESVFLHDGTYSTFRRRTHGRPVDRTRTPGWRFVASLQNHDQVGNRATGDRLSAHLSPDRLAAGATLLLTAATTPMLFMGEEWGATTPWQYFTDHTDPGIAEAVRRGRRDEFAAHGWNRQDVPDPQAEQTAIRSRLDWSEPSTAPHDRLLGWYRTLIALRRERPDLGDPRLDLVEVEHDADAQTVVVRRGAQLVLANLSPQAWTVELDPEAGLELVAAWEPDGTVATPDSVTVPAGASAILGPPG